MGMMREDVWCMIKFEKITGYEIMLLWDVEMWDNDIMGRNIKLQYKLLAG